MDPVSLVKETFTEIVNSEEFCLQTQRVTDTRKLATALLPLFDSDSDSEKKAKVSLFAQKLTALLLEIINKSKGKSNVMLSKHRENLWRLFFCHRLTEVVTIWKEFLSDDDSWQ